MKRPSFQFYPGDWLNDAALRMVSIGARGLWIDMICLMHQCADYGYLKVNGKVILTSNLARMCGATLPEIEGWVAELNNAGVFSVDGEGCIFSRRMIRDEEIRKARAEGGFKGGNPVLIAQRKVGNKDNLQPNLPPTPSSSSSSSSSKENTSARTGKKHPVPAVAFDPETGTFSGLNGHMQVWQNAFPAISIETEINKAAAWLIANPKNKKSNYARFLANWLTKAQDKAPKQGNSTKSDWTDS